MGFLQQQGAVSAPKPLNLGLLGFGFYWAWFDFFRIADTHLLPVALPPDMLVYARVGTTLGFCLGCAGLALAGRAIGSLCARPRLLAGTIAVETALSAIVYGPTWGIGQAVSPALFLAAMVLLGVFIVPLFMAWFELFSAEASGWDGRVIPVCLLINAGLLLLLTGLHFFVPHGLVALLHTALIWICLALLLREIRHVPPYAGADSPHLAKELGRRYSEAVEEVTPKDADDSATARTNQTRPFRIPAQLFFAVLAFGFLFGFVLNLPTQLAGDEHIGIGLEAFGIALAAAAFLFGLQRDRRPSSSDEARGAFSIRTVVTPFTVLGVMLIPIAGLQIPLLVTTVFWAGYDYVDLLTMYIYVQMARHLHVSPLAVNAQGQLADSFGIAAGMVAGVAIAPFIASHIELLPWVSLLAVMLILLVTQWAMTDRKISTLWGLEKLDPRAFRRQSLDAQLVAFAQTYRLTGRETDVLRGLLDRKTPQAMADEMVVSVSTVRSHIKSLYAKCSVHSKEEMARLFNEGTAERS